MAKAKAGKVFVGVGGWNFAPWRGSFYPKGLTQARELEYASQQAHLDRDQLDVLRFAEARDVQEVARRDARRIRVQRQGAEVRDQPQRSRHERIEHRTLPRQRRAATRRQARPDQLAARAGQSTSTRRRSLASSRCCRASSRAASLRHALEVRHESFDCEEFVALARDHEVAVVEAGDSDYPRIQARSAPFSYLRVMGTKASAPKGYAPAALARWREHAQTLARDGDVFLYFISGAKERNPHAAMALIGAQTPFPSKRCQTCMRAH